MKTLTTLLLFIVVICNGQHKTKAIGHKAKDSIQIRPLTCYTCGLQSDWGDVEQSNMHVHQFCQTIDVLPPISVCCICGYERQEADHYTILNKLSALGSIVSVNDTLIITNWQQYKFIKIGDKVYKINGPTITDNEPVLRSGTLTQPTPVQVYPNTHPFFRIDTTKIYIHAL